MIYRIIFLIGSLNISSCLYIPVPTPESPLDNLPQKIEVGTAQRKDVTSEFGAPRVTRENGALAIYDNSKVAAYFAEFIIIGIGGAINKYESTLSLSSMVIWSPS